jgi:pyruvate,water dikinase
MGRCFWYREGFRPLGASPHVLWFDHIRRADVALAGGKGANLGELTAAGIPVPAGFVVSTDAFVSYLEQANLSAKLADVLAGDGADRSRAARELLTEGDRPACADSVCEAYARLGGGLVAVRSSATAEDTDEASFAGQQETYLNTSGSEAVVDAVRRCWASLYEPRAMAYRAQCGMSDSSVAMAVVVQRMVQSERSGVAFTVDPITHAHDAIVIEAVRGLGEALVSGEVTPDMYVVDKATLAVRDRTIVEQRRELAYAEAGSDAPNAWRDVSAVKRTRPKLNDDEVARLAAIVRRVEEHYGTPQDIEWAECGGEFFIVQSRPVTTLQHAH